MTDKHRELTERARSWARVPERLTPGIAATLIVELCSALESSERNNADCADGALLQYERGKRDARNDMRAALGMDPL